MATHAADGTTLALWRLDESITTATFPTRDDTGLYDLTAGSTAGFSQGKVDNACAFNGTGIYRTTSNTGTLWDTFRSTLRAGIIAVEAWIRLDAALPGAEQCIFAFGSTTAGSTGNELLRVVLTTARVLNVGWQHTSKTDVVVADPSATVWAVTTWYRLGVVLNIPGSSISFWRDGVKLGTAAGPWTAPNGGEVSVPVIGRRAAAASGWFKGYIDHLHISSAAHNDATMAARAASNLISSANGAYRSAYRYWTSASRDRVSRTAGKFYQANHSIIPNLRALAAEPRSATTVRVYFSAALSAASANTDVASYSITLGGSPRTITLVSLDPASKLYADVTFTPSASYGQTHVLTIAGAALAPAQVGSIFEAASLSFASPFDCRAIAAVAETASTVRLYFSTAILNNGNANVAGNYSLTGTGAPAISSATLAGDGLSVVLATAAPIPSGTTFTVAATAGQLYATSGAINVASPVTFSRGGGTDAYPPTISSVSPTPGTALTTSTPITFTIDDPSDTLRRVFVIATFPGLSLKEVVHDGSSFGPKYQGASNTRTGNADSGWAFSILRDGGWPDAPTLEVFAQDPAGGEAVNA